MAESVKENVALITGASLGIGREMALRLAEQGARLCLAARNAASLEEVAAACRQRGGKALAVPTDVSQPAQCQALVAATLAEYRRMDTLINNAGVGMWSTFEELRDLSVPEQVMRVNYLGSLYCAYYALPALKELRGRIVGVSSLAGKTGVPLRSGYAASKHAMNGFFDSLRIELAPYGVSVTLAYPDFVDTGIQARNLGPDGRPLGKMPLQLRNAQSAADCARIILRAAAGRKREVYTTSRGRIGQWIKLVAPGLVDRMARQAVEAGQ